MVDELLHVMHRSEWLQARRAGCFGGTSIRRFGFVHCCTPAQLAGVLQRWFSDCDDLIVLSLDPGGLLPDLRWERESDGASGVFPHVYAEILVAHVLDVRALGREGDGLIPGEQCEQDWGAAREPGEPAPWVCDAERCCGNALEELPSPLRPPERDTALMRLIAAALGSTAFFRLVRRTSPGSVAARVRASPDAPQQ